MRSRARDVFTVRRVGTIVLVWAVLWAFLAWLDVRPQPLGLLGLVTLAMAAYAMSAAPEAPWLGPTWRPGEQPVRTPTRSDGRLRHLRRQLQTGIDPRDPRDADLRAERLQSLLTDITRCRLETLPGQQLSPAGLRDTVQRREPDLAAYLFADPAPHLQLTGLREIVDRIEAL